MLCFSLLYLDLQANELVGIRFPFGWTYLHQPSNGILGLHAKDLFAVRSKQSIKNFLTLDVHEKVLQHKLIHFSSFARLFHASLIILVASGRTNRQGTDGLEKMAVKVRWKVLGNGQRLLIWLPDSVLIIIIVILIVGTIVVICIILVVSIVMSIVIIIITTMAVVGLPFKQFLPELHCHIGSELGLLLVHTTTATTSALAVVSVRANPQGMNVRGGINQCVGIGSIGILHEQLHGMKGLFPIGTIHPRQQDAIPMKGNHFHVQFVSRLVPVLHAPDNGRGGVGNGAIAAVRARKDPHHEIVRFAIGLGPRAGQFLHRCCCCCRRTGWFLVKEFHILQNSVGPLRHPPLILGPFENRR